MMLQEEILHQEWKLLEVKVQDLNHNQNHPIKECQALLEVEEEKITEEDKIKAVKIDSFFVFITIFASIFFK
jgi:uncharacterized protein YchJ